MTAPDLLAIVKKLYGTRWIVDGQVNWRGLLNWLAVGLVKKRVK